MARIHEMLEAMRAEMEAEIRDELSQGAQEGTERDAKSLFSPPDGFEHVVLTVPVSFDVDEMYERYQLMWMLEHGKSLSRYRDILCEELCETLSDNFPHIGEVLEEKMAEAHSNFVFDRGFGGEIFACKGEWLDAEWSEAPVSGKTGTFAEDEELRAMREAVDGQSDDDIEDEPETQDTTAEVEAEAPADDVAEPEPVVEETEVGPEPEPEPEPEPAPAEAPIPDEAEDGEEDGFEMSEFSDFEDDAVEDDKADDAEDGSDEPEAEPEAEDTAGEEEPADVPDIEVDRPAKEQIEKSTQEVISRIHSASSVKDVEPRDVQEDASWVASLVNKPSKELPDNSGAHQKMQPVVWGIPDQKDDDLDPEIWGENIDADKKEDPDDDNDDEGDDEDAQS